MGVDGTKIVHDFTLEKYRELCETLLDSDYIPLTVYDYLRKKNSEEKISHNIVVLRHDVDRKPHNALRMAELENLMGIQSTYYFRYPYTFKTEIVQEVQKLKHEIGYHYEVFAKTKGDPEAAIQLFSQELKAMRDICNIRTICMHGSPLSKFDNRNLWQYYNFMDFGIIGEAYISMTNLFYLTDTGRSWNFKHSMRDRFEKNILGDKPETTDDLIDIISSEKYSPIYLTTHPERWSSNSIGFFQGFIQDFIFNLGKSVLSGIRK